MTQEGRAGRGWRRKSRAAVVLAIVAVTALAGCEAGITHRQAPSPIELYGGAVQPVAQPVLLRYRPVGAVQLAATMEAKAEVHNHHFSWTSSLSGRATIEPVGDGLIGIHAEFRVGSHQLDEDLNVRPFSVDLLMTDRGEIIEQDWQFAAADRLSDARRESIIGTVAHLFPIPHWPLDGIAPGESFSAISLQASRDGVVMRETGDMDLRIDAEIVHDGRPAYLIGFTGRAQSYASNEAISGYYIVDAQTGFVLEHRYVGRDKSYVQQFLVNRDYSVEAQLRP